MSLWLACCRTWAARGLAFHGSTQNAVDTRLVTPALGPEPFQHVCVEANAELLFGWRPSRRCLPKEGFAERRNVGIVDVGIGHPVNPCQVAFDRFPAHVRSPSSWR